MKKKQPTNNEKTHKFFMQVEVEIWIC